MAHWHEVKRDRGGFLFGPLEGHRVAARFEGYDIRVEPFEGQFLRHESKPYDSPLPFSVWKREPEGWFVLTPRNPILVSSNAEAKEIFERMWLLVESGEIDDQFVIEPYIPPVIAQIVKEVEHDTRVAKAIIGEYPDGKFVIQYAVYAPNGAYWPMSTPSISAELDWEWGVTWPKNENGESLRTYADSLASAEEIALKELYELVAKDNTIKKRSEHSIDAH